MNVGNYRDLYRDIYSAGVVLNSRFLDICDEAFTEYFRALGFPPEALYAVTNNGALDHMGNTSLVLTYSITRDGAVVFTGTARYVNIDDSGQPVPVPTAVRPAVHTR